MITMIKTKTCPVERSSAFRLRKITGEKGSLPGVGGIPCGFEDEIQSGDGEGDDDNDNDVDENARLTVWV